MSPEVGVASQAARIRESEAKAGMMRANFI
jgi:hypothetical protein